MEKIIISVRPKWCEKICHVIGKDEMGKPIYEKRIEVRKSAPKEVPFKAYIYATRPKKYYKCGAVCTSDELLWLSNGKVEMGDGFKFWADGDEYQCLNGRIIGEFICDEVEESHEWELSPQGKFADFERERLENFLTAACLSEEEVVRYRENLPYFKPLYGWHISDLKIYDKPKELSEFRPICKFEGKDLICNLCPNHEYNGGLFFECRKKLTRPPQSYMFVEEVEQ